MSSEKVIKEDWFRKRGGKGANISTQVGNGKRKYFVLTEKYLDWYEMPKGHRKGSLALDNIYVRHQPENSLLVIGQYGRPNEFKIAYEGPNPRDELQKWYDSITKAIDEFKKKKVDTSSENFKLVVDRGTERDGDFLDGHGKKETYTTTTVTQNNPPPPTIQQTIVSPPIIQQPLQQTIFTPPIIQQQPIIQQTMINTPPPMIQTMVNPMMQTTSYNPGFYQPPPMMQTTTYNPGFYQPPPMQTTTTYSPYGNQTTTFSSGMPTMCQFCRMSFQAVPGGLSRCPYCQQVNGPQMQTTTMTYTGMPPYY
jgi:hypothetical protein